MRRKGKYTKKPSLKQRISRGLAHPFQRNHRVNRKKLFLIIGSALLAFLILTPLITYAIFARDIADPERLMNRSQTGVALFDKEGRVFYRTANSKEVERVKLNNIAKPMQKALIASEDQSFYKHSGISFRGMLGALYGNIIQHDATAYGGSTLTQQLVKNTLLTDDKNFLRKYQELFMAVAVERTYSKDQILEMYLNSVYFGENAFGIKEAARTYFNKSPSELTVAESSMLVGLLPAPSAYSPISGDAELAKRQQKRVLKLMEEEKYITHAEREAAENEPLAYAPPQSHHNTEAPHFATMVIDELKKKYGEEKVIRSGFKVKTGLDLDWQREAEKIVADQTAINAYRGGNDAALVAIDPKTGEIRALVGSSDWNNPEFGQVNMAIGKRQPGSSFKPIYYTQALENKLITPATIMHDKPTTYGTYKPENYDFRFRGDITVRDALSQSLNIPAVDVMQELGVKKAVETAKRMGISTLKNPDQYGLSLALGAAEVKPLEMTNAYAAFANKGLQYKATSIVEIDDKFGAKAYKYTPEEKRVMGSGASFLISDILSDNAARAPTFGSSLNTSRDTAVKTGSTDDNRDAWTIGYTPDIAVGVWVGNDKNEPMQVGGSAMAGPIWRKSIETFFDDLPNSRFSAPSSVSEVSICYGSGARAIHEGSNTYKEFFLSGAQPNKTCNESSPKREEQPPKQETTPEPPRTPQPEQVEPDPDTPEDPDQPTDPGTDPTNPNDPSNPNNPTNPPNGNPQTQVNP